MSYKLILNLLLILSLVGSACQRESPEEKIAEKFCQCFGEMTELYRQVQSQEIGEENDVLLGLMSDLETAARESENCVEQVETAYGELLDRQEEQIKALMQKRCPKVVETLEEIDAGYE